MHKSLLTISLLFIAFTISSQELISHHIGKGRNLNQFDKIGSFYYQVGIFDDEVTVGFNDESQIISEIGNGINNQIYIVKYDLDFNIVWASAVKFTDDARRVQMKYRDGFLYLLWTQTGSGGLFHYCHRVNVDDPDDVDYMLRFESGYNVSNLQFEINDEGALAVAGTYRDRVEFRLNGFDKEYFCNSEQNIFLVRYGFLGNGSDYSHIVQREWGNPGANERRIHTIKFDDEENIHLFGYGEGSVQLDGNLGEAIGHGAAFQVTYSKSNELVQFTENESFFFFPALTIPIENNNIAFIGGPSYTILNEDYEILSSEFVEYNSNQKIVDVAVSDDSYTALFEFRPSIYEQSLGDFNFMTNTLDYAMINYDFEGNMNWYTYFGGDSGWDYPYSIDYLENGNLLVSGYTEDNLDIDPSYQVLKLDYDPNQFFVAEYSIVCQGLNTGLKNISHITCSENAQLEFGINGGTSPYEFYFDNELTANYEAIEVSETGLYEAYVIDEESCSKSVFVPVNGPSTDSNEKMRLHQHADEFRTGFETNVYYSLNNQNCVTKSGYIKIILDDQIEYLDASITPASVDGQSLVFEYNDLIYQDVVFNLNLDLKISEDAVFGNFLCSRIYVYDEAWNEIDNNIICKEVINSYDPNDISVSPYGRCDENFFLNEEELEYTIRFQNLGNAEAINVIIVDTLSTSLDINSFVETGTSHNSTVHIEEDSILIISYKDIYLPAEEQDEEGSNGYFSYKINVIQDLVFNTQIRNRAAIYFDFNDPVITNTVRSTNTDELPTCIRTNVDEVQGISFDFYPNPVLETLTIEHDAIPNAPIEIFDGSGKQFNVSINSSTSKTILDLNTLNTGLYFINIDGTVIRVFKE